VGARSALPAFAGRRRRDTFPPVPRLIALLLVLAACAATPPPAPAPAPAVLPSATRDYDRDGFPDPRDRCPREAGEAPLGCPELDEDNDGVTTSFDRCPGVTGLKPDGCPPPDADADGVADEFDRCADGLETRNGFEDADGCADVLPKDLARFAGIIKGIHFATDKDTLQARSNSVLAKAFAVLKRYPAVRIEISGHGYACESGDDLTLRRAESVKRHLVGRGVDPARIETRGACDKEPVAAPSSPEGRTRNRRIEFKLLGQ
jgi:outer membrane protein OmpA-like peptidoglycan-associated protein